MKQFYIGFLVFLFPTLFLTPNLMVKWAQDRKGFDVELQARDEHVAQCIASGLEVRYRLEYQICRRRESWFDRCAERKLIARTVQYDPVSESYTIKTDLLSDSEPAATIMETDPELAAAKISEFYLNSFGDLAPDQLEEGPTVTYYVSTRIRGYCQREEQSLLTQIPYYLTLGIFRFTGFDTGWIDHNL